MTASDSTATSCQAQPRACGLTSVLLTAQARLRVGKRLKQLQSARKQLLARLHRLANPTPEVYDEAIEASAALQANMQAHSKVGWQMTGKRI